MQRPVCWLAVLLALSGFAAAADDALATVHIPGGISDSAGKVGYLSSPKGGVVAVDLEEGTVLWESKDANRPLAASGKRLAALIAEKGKENVVCVVILDTEAKGKRLLQSEPIKLPEWAMAGTGLDHHQAGKIFTARGRLVSGSVVLQWWAGSRYYGGARPTDEILKEATKDAAGETRVDVETGKIETKLNDKMATPGTGLTDVAKLPKEVQEVAQKEMWQAGIVVGPRAYGLVVKNKGKANPGGGIFGGLQVHSVQAVDAKTGKVLWERAYEEHQILPPPP